MNPPTSFSSLPPELVTKIYRDSTLGKEDLIALRLTSKSQGIHLSASEEFAKRYFEDINLVYTRYSLQAFVEICKHPVFGSAVRNVQLSYYRFKSDRFEEESKGLLNQRQYGPRSQGRHDYLKNIRLLVNRCDEEEDLTRSGDAEDLLAAAFAALSNWRHPLVIAVSNECPKYQGPPASSADYSPLGQNRILIPSALSKKSHWECDILGTVNLLYHAAIRGTCAVQALRIRGDFWGESIDSSSESLSSLAQLSELELNIVSSRVTSLDGMVTKLLEHAVHLKTLELESWSIGRKGDLKYIRKTLSIASRMKLEKMTLAAIDIDQINPLENRFESLRHLELIKCYTNTRLKDVLLSIQKNFPRLEYLRVSGVDPGQETEFRSVQEVNDGIDELLQSTLKHYDNPGWTALWDSDED
ncbi:hypothetical protein KCU92_g9596, partial [Aureobasidium melanogenum]|jgi:hypothetical protein